MTDDYLKKLKRLWLYSYITCFVFTLINLIVRAVVYFDVLVEISLFGGYITGTLTGLTTCIAFYLGALCIVTLMQILIYNINTKFLSNKLIPLCMLEVLKVLGVILSIIALHSILARYAVNVVSYNLYDIISIVFSGIFFALPCIADITMFVILSLSDKGKSQELISDKIFSNKKNIWTLFYILYFLFGFILWVVLQIRGIVVHSVESDYFDSLILSFAYVIIGVGTFAIYTLMQLLLYRNRDRNPKVYLKRIIAFEAIKIFCTIMTMSFDLVYFFMPISVIIVVVRELILVALIVFDIRIIVHLHKKKSKRTLLSQENIVDDPITQVDSQTTI